MKSVIRTLDMFICWVGGITIWLFSKLFYRGILVPLLLVVFTLIVCTIFYTQPVEQNKQVIGITTTIQAPKPVVEEEPTLLERINDSAVKKIIYQQARYVGVDPEYMLILASMESSFRVSIKSSGVGATGLFQFTKVTWDYLKTKYGDKFNIPKTAKRISAKYNARMAAVYVSHIKDVLQDKGVSFSYSFAYLGHFLGPTNMVKFIRANPFDNAVSIFSEAAESNPAVFYDNGQPRTVIEVLEFVNKRIDFNRGLVFNS